MTREEREERLAKIRGGKIENLPKWAQNRIQILERDLLDDTPINDPEDHAARRDEALEEKANNPERGRRL